LAARLGMSRLGPCPLPPRAPPLQVASVTGPLSKVTPRQLRPAPKFESDHIPASASGHPHPNEPWVQASLHWSTCPLCLLPSLPHLFPFYGSQGCTSRPGLREPAQIATLEAPQPRGGTALRGGRVEGGERGTRSHGGAGVA
jgi:hypothetical protein